MRKPSKPVLVVLGVGLGFIVLMGLIKYVQISRAIAQHQSMKPPPESITAAVAKEDVWEKTLAAVGSLKAVQGVVLSAEEAGKVVKINFESGQAVAQGAVLVELDTSVEEANLRAASALWEQAHVALLRAQTLRKNNANSQADLDNAVANEHSTSAAGESLRASIAKKRIIAPFAGRTGIRSVNVGQYVNPGNEVVPLFSLDPLYVNFSLPEQYSAQVATGQNLRIAVDAFNDQVFDGKITAVNSHVDPVTRNIAVQGTIANPKELLRPGMFADVTVILAETEKVVQIPSSSVTYAPYGDTVYVIEDTKGPDGSQYLGVRQQVVKLGRTRGDQVSVLTGLKGGEQVATSGGFKLRTGAAVAVNTTVTPGNDPNPHPADT